MAGYTGVKVNRGGGYRYGLEVPCIYHFYGSKSYIDKLKKLVDDLLSDGRLRLVYIYADYACN